MRGNCSREETIWGNTLYELYLVPKYNDMVPFFFRYYLDQKYWHKTSDSTKWIIYWKAIVCLFYCCQKQYTVQAEPGFKSVGFLFIFHIIMDRRLPIWWNFRKCLPLELAIPWMRAYLNSEFEFRIHIPQSLFRSWHSWQLWWSRFGKGLFQSWKRWRQ